PSGYHSGRTFIRPNLQSRVRGSLLCHVFDAPTGPLVVTPNSVCIFFVVLSLAISCLANQRVQYDLIPIQLSERHTDAIRANCPTAPGRRSTRLLPGWGISGLG